MLWCVPNGLSFDSLAAPVKVWYRAASQSVKNVMVTITRAESKDPETFKRKLILLHPTNATSSGPSISSVHQVISQSDSDSEEHMSSHESKDSVEYEPQMDSELVTKADGDISIVNDGEVAFVYWEAKQQPLSIYLSASLISRKCCALFIADVVTAN